MSEKQDEKEENKRVNRVLATDREIEVLQGRGSDNHRYVVRSKIRDRIARLKEEMEALEAVAPDLHGETQDVLQDDLEQRLATLENRFEAYDLD
ncbi:MULTISPECIES: hypothetical protein [unclassified Haloarcula]|uniref:hypothetical protein n=1 Tax=unclassified Haloarcula TaxID=2624677 RepID=UPI000EF262EC|nr:MULTISPECIES: hypothetical protein [unclassified Haloarcula]RLM37206.1 hypothetical protein DVK01_11445 [Haloarcula sp. Atlit-120R]RLM44404.1 hypothetical protein DVK00_08015 [Haloarcula sp. Atlit-47R]